MTRSIGLAAALALALLGGCSDDKPVGGVSADEAAALNNAAEMLDASPDGLAAPTDMQPANGAESESGGGNEMGNGA